MKALLFTAILILLSPLSQTWAFTWHDLWVTKNHQAQNMMNAGQFSKAQETFEDPAWKATAAYRAGNYKDAAIHYQSIQNNIDAYYNEGNALAKAGQLEPAIKAYDNVLTLDPAHKDALYNRKIVEELLKKQKQNKKDQNNKDKNQQNQNKQDQDKQNQNKQDQDKQDQNKQDQDKQDQDKQDQDKQDQDKQDQDKQDQDKQDQDKQDQKKQEQDKQDQDKQDQDKQDQNKKSPEKSPQSQADREQQQAKEQWLRLIPDDPGGLMREKFLRDYLSRHRN